MRNDKSQDLSSVKRRRQLKKTKGFGILGLSKLEENVSSPHREFMN